MCGAVLLEETVSATVRLEETVCGAVPPKQMVGETVPLKEMVGETVCRSKKHGVRLCEALPLEEAVSGLVNSMALPVLAGPDFVRQIQLKEFLKGQLSAQ